MCLVTKFLKSHPVCIIKGSTYEVVYKNMSDSGSSYEVVYKNMSGSGSMVSKWTRVMYRMFCFNCDYSGMFQVNETFCFNN
jgi:hypothetical protein